MHRASNAHDPGIEIHDSCETLQESEHVALTTVKPLVVLHIKLRQIGARVAYASMLSWVARQADNPSSRWHKQIARGERSKGSKLEQGMR